MKDKIGNGKLLPWYISKHMHKSVNVDNFLPDLIDTQRKVGILRKTMPDNQEKSKCNHTYISLTRSCDVKIVVLNPSVVWSTYIAFFVPGTAS
jgi:hypothetical protein